MARAVSPALPTVRILACWLWAPRTTRANQTIEPFSSRGPTPDGRVKPDIVGVDRVHSTVYQGLFEGTSQAAPARGGSGGAGHTTVSGF